MSTWKTQMVWMSKTLLLFEISTLLIIAAIVGWMLFAPEPGLERCQQVTPEHYEMTTHVVIFNRLNCYYETLPEYGYNTCQKIFGKSQNHGIIITANNCPGGH